MCGENVVLKTSKQKGYLEPEQYQIYHCPHCNTAFSVPRVEDSSEVYNLIYRNAENLDGYGDYLQLSKNIKNVSDPLRYLTCNNSNSLTYWSIVYALKRIVKAKRSSIIFEIGSGLGYLTYALRKSGYSITGLDISETAVKEANLYFGNYYISGDINEYANKHESSADVIILTEVIEHVNEPMKMMSSLKKMLRKGGSIILTTPNKSFYPMDSIWETDLPPVHCWWFGEESMAYMAKKLDMKLELLDYSNSYAVNMSPPKYAGAKESYHIFDANGNVIKEKTPIRHFGILPQWFKKSQFYRIMSTNLYPFINLFLPKYKRVIALCAVFTK